VAGRQAGRQAELWRTMQHFVQYKDREKKKAAYCSVLHMRIFIISTYRRDRQSFLMYCSLQKKKKK